MKIALFTGTALRHTYYANEVIANHDVVLHVRETRSNELIDEIKVEYSEGDEKLLRIHSDARLEADKKYYLPKAEKFLEAHRIIEVERRKLNSPEVMEAVKETKPDVVLVYGTSLIKDELLSLMPMQVINLHAGLSPYYKGSATLYWPLYFMEPQNVGFTLHNIDLKIDHGDILHQGKPEIVADDGIHDLGCKTIIKAARDIHGVLKKIEEGTLQSFEQKSLREKTFLESEFKPYHLRVTNFLMANGLLREYVSFKERFPEAKIISQI